MSGRKLSSLLEFLVGGKLCFKKVKGFKTAGGSSIWKSNIEVNDNKRDVQDSEVFQDWKSIKDSQKI